MSRLVWILYAAVLVAFVGWDFAAATTFIGDDHIFRVFARIEPNPLVAFVSDKHGGEYYRPLPMLLWWVLEHLSHGQVWAFALAALLLHLLCSVLLGLLGRALGLAKRTAFVAAALFFAAPAEREAALWFSASTDLLAAAAGLASLICFLSSRRWARGASVALALVAYFSKETALVLPLLLAAACYFHVRDEAHPLRRCVARAAPAVVAAAAYLGLRFVVLGDFGGTNDPLAPWWGRGLQLASGLVHAVTAYAPLPPWVAWLVGVPLLLWIAVVALRRRGPGSFCIAFVAITLLPLPAAGWVVGARYFYLPAAGLMLLLAMALEPAGRRAAAAAAVVLLGLGVVWGSQRAGEVKHYEQAVTAAGQAIAEGSAQGHRIFLVRGAVKDLDIALKLDRRLPPSVRETVVIPDVPASFVWLPAVLAGQVGFLLASPPLPPSGAYRFGGQILAGLARREEAPDLDEVIARLPGLRVIHLRREGDRYAWQDRTADYQRRE